MAQKHHKRQAAVPLLDTEMLHNSTLSYNQLKVVLFKMALDNED